MVWRLSLWVPVRSHTWCSEPSRERRAACVLCNNGLHYTTMHHVDTWRGWGKTLMAIEVLDKEHGMVGTDTKAVCRAFKILRPAVPDVAPLSAVVANDTVMEEVEFHDPEAMRRWSSNTVVKFFHRLCLCPCKKAQAEAILGFALDPPLHRNRLPRLRPPLELSTSDHAVGTRSSAQRRSLRSGRSTSTSQRTLTSVSANATCRKPPRHVP